MNCAWFALTIIISYISLVSWYCNHDLSPVEPQEPISHQYHHHHHHHNIWSYLILSDVWCLMFDDDYLWYLIHWMFDEYSGYSSIFGQKTKSSRDCLCAAGTRTALRCLGTTQAAAGMPRCRKWWANEPIPQEPRNGAQFPWHFHLKTETWPDQADQRQTWKRNAKLAEFEV